MESVFSKLGFLPVLNVNIAYTYWVCQAVLQRYALEAGNLATVEQSLAATSGEEVNYLFTGYIYKTMWCVRLKARAV